jgi:hypothetical protein
MEVPQNIPKEFIATDSKGNRYILGKNPAFEEIKDKLKTPDDFFLLYAQFFVVLKNAPEVLQGLGGGEVFYAGKGKYHICLDHGGIDITSDDSNAP